MAGYKALFESVMSQETCVYSISIKTGSRSDAGTDAVVSLKLSNMQDSAINIQNLEKYGIMEAGHDYFENNNLDFFNFPGPCLTIPVCYIKLSHDNSGNKPGWYINYVEINTAGGSITPTKIRFDVSQWLSDGEPPYQTYTSRDFCADKEKRSAGIESVVDVAI
ncbi:PLAT domain-containing protein 2-like [Mercurialis annua]|uniref:PLAT domain-containing protein 2-like n=1 Tax=Mercurialis annua TaxID=3986 RepID=UPI00216034B8|nr:PLAT domain-containing protein 2-like [Mercurialis annua]